MVSFRYCIPSSTGGGGCATDVGRKTFLVRRKLDANQTPPPPPPPHRHTRVTRFALERARVPVLVGAGEAAHV